MLRGISYEADLVLAVDLHERDALCASVTLDWLAWSLRTVVP